MDVESLINICYSLYNERQETLKALTDNGGLSVRNVKHMINICENIYTI
jgi:hypothetical protein